MSMNPKATKLERVLRYERQVVCCRQSPDQAFLYAGGFEGQLHRWALNDKDTHEVFHVHGGWIENMVLHPDGARLYTADSWGQVKCWPVGSGKLEPHWTISDANATWLRRLAISPKGDQIATCGNDHMVRVFTTGDGKLAREFKGHDSHVHSVGFHPDGIGLASGDLRGVVKHWDLRNGRCTRDLDASKLFKKYHQYDQGGVRCLTFDREGKTLFCAGFEGANANQAQGIPMVIAFDWDSGKSQSVMTPRSNFTGPIFDVLYHPDGYLIAAGSSEAGGAIWFWKPGQEKDEHEVRFMNSFRGMDLHRDGKRLAVAAFGNRDGQRGGNGRRLVNGEYVDFEGSIVFYGLG